MMSNRIMRL